MKIELKHFKHYERLSEETECFTANLYINGIKCATAENRGIGGSTDYCPEFSQTCRDLVKQAEQYCSSLPPDSFEYKGEITYIAMSLEYYIDRLANDLIKAKYALKDAQKLRKNMKKAILIGNEETYTKIGFKFPLKVIINAHPDYFRKVLKEKLNKYAINGNRLLNTNIPQNFIN